MSTGILAGLLALLSVTASADPFVDDRIEADLDPCTRQLELHQSKLDVFQRIFRGEKRVAVWRQDWRQAVASREAFTGICARRAANPTQADAALLKEVQNGGDAAVRDAKKFQDSSKALLGDLWTAINPMYALGGNARACSAALGKVRDFIRTKAERENADLRQMKNDCQYRAKWRMFSR